MYTINRINNTNNYLQVGAAKHFPSLVRQWDNVIYVYNKNTLCVLPNTTKFAIKLIKAYFSLYNKNIEIKIRTLKMLNRSRKFSSNKIYLSNGEFKHTNNKVIITLYLFNRQKNNYLLKLKIGYLEKWYEKNYKSKNLSNKEINLKQILLKRLKTINIKGLIALKKANRYKHNILNILNNINDKNNLQNYKAISDYINKFYKKLIRKSLRKIEMYIYYRQLILINKSKLNYTYLKYLEDYLKTIFNKNVEFNFVNLKHFYLNSNILSESILLKITRNRRSLLRYLNKLTNKVKIHTKNLYSSEILDVINLGEKKNLNQETYLLEKHIINSLKYKHVTGFRLEAKGRLTRRYTASKSVYKFKYKGNLVDIDSTHRALSTVLLKGNIKSNVQYTKLNSKSRIGSFGIKGWVAGN